MNQNKFAKSLDIKEVNISGKFWQDLMEKVRTQVIPYQWEALNDRIPDAEPSYWMRNFHVAAGKETGEFGGCVFQDSDGAKWIEAAAYSLAWYPDPDLEALVDGAIDDIVEAQQPDGYLNTYYIINGLEKRFTNLTDNHELYCLGHFLEGAIAYYQATGKDKLLNAMMKYVDLVDSLFGSEEGKLHGYPGHEEIELALVKLYDITGKEKYLKLAEYFIMQRGQAPLYFEKEKENADFYWEKSWFQYNYYQAGIPVLEQETAVGHAVRAVYLYTGMAEVAYRSGDENLIEACRRLWENVTKRQMYVTGAIGSSSYGEAFTFDYDLPNDTVYAETCASIGLVFFAQKMLNANLQSEYADVIEKCLYNGIISGMSADGKSFFYVNPLEVLPEASEKDQLKRHVVIQRQKWFGCSCCPPNLARLISALASYAYSKTDDGLYVHLYTEGQIRTEFPGGFLDLQVITDYPWNSRIEFFVNSVPEDSFDLALRIPGWCKAWNLSLNGEKRTPEICNGYVQLKQQLNIGDKICLDLEMPVTVLEANPRIRENIGKVCVSRGPVIYCMEEADNGNDLHRIYLNPEIEFTERYDRDFFGGAILLESSAKKLDESRWTPDELYRPADSYIYENIQLKWIPYYLWANREPGEMTVWVKKLS